MEEQSSFCHVCTEGLENCDLFIDREDFICGFNKIAIAFRLGPCPVEIGSCIEMSNHIHLLPYGPESHIYYDLMRFERMYSMYYSEKYGISKVFKGVKHSIKPCGSSEGQYLKDVIGYIYRNPVHHRVTSNPYVYEWSTFKVHFDNNNYVGKRDEPILNLKKTEKRKILKTNEEVPDSWAINTEGMVTFKSIVNPSLVENVVRTSNSLLYFINKRKEVDSMECPSGYTDHSARVLMLNIIKNRFGMSIPQEIMDQQEGAVSKANGNYKSLMERRKNRINIKTVIDRMSSEQRSSVVSEMVSRFGVSSKVIRRILQ